MEGKNNTIVGSEQQQDSSLTKHYCKKENNKEIKSPNQEKQGTTLGNLEATTIMKSWLKETLTLKN